MLPWPHTFDHFRETYTLDAAGGTLQAKVSIATNISCQVDSTGGSSEERFGGDGMTQRARVITEYSAIQNGDVLAIQTGTQNYYKVLGGDQPMIATSGVIPTTYYWDVERWRDTV